MATVQVPSPSPLPRLTGLKGENRNPELSGLSRSQSGSGPLAGCGGWGGVVRSSPMLEAGGRWGRGQSPHLDGVMHSIWDQVREKMLKGVRGGLGGAGGGVRGRGEGQQAPSHSICGDFLSGRYFIWDLRGFFCPPWTKRTREESLLTS